MSAKYRVLRQSRPAFPAVECYVVEILRGHPDHPYWQQAGIALHETQEDAIAAAREHERRSAFTTSMIVWESESGAIANPLPMC